MRQHKITWKYSIRVVALLLVLLTTLPLWANVVSAIQVEAPQVSSSTMDISALQQHGIYTVAYTEDYSPFSNTDTSGNPSGMAISIMDYIAQLAGIEIEYVSVDQANRYDLPVDINLAILAEDQIDDVSIRSLPYTSLQMMAVSNTPQLQLEGATVGHLPYAFLDNNAISDALPGATPYTYYSYTEMAAEYVEGNLNHMLVTSLISSQMLDTAYQVDTYVIPTEVNLNFYMSYSDTMSSEEIVAFDSIIRSLDAAYVYSLMLSSVIAATDTEITLSLIIQTYAVPILISILVVVASVAAIMLRANQVKRKALEHIINVDELTGLLTERKFLKEVETRLQTASSGEYFIVTIDIDHFKFINEIYGYDVGTSAIVLFSQMLQEIFPPNTMIARFFADHFVILYHGKNQTFYIKNAEEYEDYIAQTMSKLLGETYRLTTSSGIYQIEDTTLPISYMIDCANVARLRGKSSYGISKIQFTKPLEQHIHQRNDIVRTMEDAITEKEFQIYYQPKVCLETGELAGAEALIRWIRHNGQYRYPDEFIPLFESNGFIRKVDLFVLEEVCSFLQRNPQIPKISVNFSGFSILNDQVVSQIQDITHQYGILPSRLEIEITESAVVRNFEPIIKQTSKLKKLGFPISMDDFGAGISSLNRLKDLDFDVLKIDKGFLGTTQLNERSIAIIQHIISMARELGIATVAEGVESCEQEALLRTLGCDMAQGYYYARPLDESAYLDYVKNER